MTARTKKAPTLTPRLRTKMERCSGCRDDYYNPKGRGAGPGMNGFCWNLPSAKLVTKFRTHRDTMPATPGAFEQVRVYDCYHSPPFVFQSAVQSFVKIDEVINSPAWKRKHQRQARLAAKIERSVIRRAAAPPAVDIDPDDIPF